MEGVSGAAQADEDIQHLIDACFLGPYGENDGLLEKLAVEFLRDHVYWRRNFHPEDPPAIPTHAATHPAYRGFEARMRRELHALSAALKQSVPFHSPRYIGHMASDLLLPGLAAQMLTLPYNPNNVSEEAAPVTVDLEVRVGLQLARLFGYPDDTTRPDCAFGHLTSGGTLANYQALRLALALKAFPVALVAAGVPGLDAPDNVRDAFNLAPAQGIELLERWRLFLRSCTAAERRRWQARVEAERLEQRGLHDFFATHDTLRAPVVLAPVTAHYSWSKGMKLLGLGRAQLRTVPERRMRMDPDALETALSECARHGQPVLMTVGVLGTTEFGSVDPIDRIVDARDRWAQCGLGFSVHVDAAWGGYLATLFRNADGTLRPREEVAAPYAQFPRPPVHAAFAALARTDSITVDPHKLGYLPYGAGAFVARDQRPMDLLAEHADYVFHGGDEADYFSRHRRLGLVIPEGSKPGAAAAAVYVTHRVLPLDHANFGVLPAQTIRATEHFLDCAQAFARTVADVAHAAVPFMPDCNLVCLAINPRGNTQVAAANTFVSRLRDELRCDASLPLQAKQFFGSATTLKPAHMGARDLDGLCQALHLDAGTFDDDGADRLVILRHTLMNPFLIDRANGISYIEQYFAYLEKRVRALTAAER